MLTHRNKRICLLTWFVMSSEVLVHPPSVAWQTLLTIQKRNGDCLSVFFCIASRKTFWILLEFCTKLTGTLRSNKGGLRVLGFFHRFKMEADCMTSLPQNIRNRILIFNNLLIITLDSEQLICIMNISHTYK